MAQSGKEHAEKLLTEKRQFIHEKHERHEANQDLALVQRLTHRALALGL